MQRSQQQWCEGCQERKASAFRRAETGKIQCDKCYLETLRGDSPTGLVPTLRLERAE